MRVPLSEGSTLNNVYMESSVEKMLPTGVMRKRVRRLLWRRCSSVDVSTFLIVIIDHRKEWRM